MIKKLENLKAEDLHEGTVGRRLFDAFAARGKSLRRFCDFAGISEKRLISILMDEKEINLQEIRYVMISLRLTREELKAIFFPPDPIINLADYQKERGIL